jgi:hypothetical protein
MRHRSERTTLKHYIAVNKDRCKDEHQRIMNAHSNEPSVSIISSFKVIQQALVNV